MIPLPAARILDFGTGHSCYPTRPNIEGSENVFINLRPTHRLLDKWAIHNCGPDSHDGILTKGSTSVFVNKRPVGRVLDPINCGSYVATGSRNVFIGG